MQPPAPIKTSRLIIIGAIVLFLLHGVNPLMNALGLDAYRYPTEARAFSDKIVPITNKHIKDISEPSSRPLMLHIYASWCPYCQQQNPAIVDIIDERSNRMDIMMLSIDQNKYQLSQFLLKKEQPLPYTPYMMPRDAYPALASFLSGAGGSFSGAIPYTVIFDGDRKMVAEYPGLVQRSDIEDGLAKLDQ
ncbi:MAG: redoxin domain-containing protein [Rickettsiales bacterium]|nr:redoxin domain-containing protein [Rickettsiales bacterium]